MLDSIGDAPLHETALLRRVRGEVRDLLLPIYGMQPHSVSFDTKNGTWACVKQLPVPQRLTHSGDGRVDILLLIPPTYPQIPPDGFYCDFNLNLKEHYYPSWKDTYYPDQQSQLVKNGWQWFCAHAHHSRNSYWQPSTQTHQGDNLLTYLHLCLAILGTEGEKT
ncbi:MAG: hypothetical protein MUF38_06000 [Anaerolineae bacterium]|jgi:hypothetical protein|nr:hypothetical protein [Anaerolineae bacterium]